MMAQTTLLTSLTLLADKPAGGGGPPLMVSLMPWLLIGFVFYLLLIRPQQREHARRKQMLAGIKKNDRVITAGGIYGVVTNIHAEADEVTIKVDEATNTKLRMTLSSITRVLGEEKSDDASKQKA